MKCITLTGNLLIEWTLYYKAIRVGKTQRAHHESFQVGGKGINVSKMLNRLGVENTATYFSQGDLNNLAKNWFNFNNIKSQVFTLGDIPRIGLIARTESSEKTETTFLGKDKPIPLESWSCCLDWIANKRPKTLAICGSLPGWSEDHHASLENFLQNSNTKVFLDTYGQPLKDLSKSKLECIKINRDEFNSIGEGFSNLNAKEVCDWIKQNSNCSNWIITNGPSNALVCSQDGDFIVNPIQIDEASPTGCGDVTFAGLISKRLSGNGWKDSIRFAFACGSANATRPGIADFELPVQENYFTDSINSIKN